MFPAIHPVNKRFLGSGADVLRELVINSLFEKAQRQPRFPFHHTDI